ncbi:MAG: hypothetical protein CMLOHMNK_02452 [Steroidobacteraceae bacterium]|nr:hypothetical protein [Steroidobacteraceae bacterium]
MTALSVLSIIAFAALGRWQWHRGIAREATWQEFTAEGIPPAPLGAQALESLARFSRLRLTGRYDGAHQFLLDNRTHAGMAGYEVLTPFDLDDGRTVLVNRGWVPFSGYRDRLPEIGLADAGSRVTIAGRVDTLPLEGMASGRAPPAPGGAWPKVTSFPHVAELAAALGRPIETCQVLLDASQPAGYVRSWQPPGIPPERNFSYAVQWWLFATTVAVLYGALNLHKVDR